MTEKTNTHTCNCNCDCNNIPSHKMCQLSQPQNKFNTEQKSEFFNSVSSSLRNLSGLKIQGLDDLKKVRKLTSNPQFICKCCGRTANNKENLCNPSSLN